MESVLRNFVAGAMLLAGAGGCEGNYDRPDAGADSDKVCALTNKVGVHILAALDGIELAMGTYGKEVSDGDDSCFPGWPVSFENVTAVRMWGSSFVQCRFLGNQEGGRSQIHQTLVSLNVL